MIHKNYSDDSANPNNSNNYFKTIEHTFSYVRVYGFWVYLCKSSTNGNTNRLPLSEVDPKPRNDSSYNDTKHNRGIVDLKVGRKHGKTHTHIHLCYPDDEPMNLYEDYYIPG